MSHYWEIYFKMLTKLRCICTERKMFSSVNSIYSKEHVLNLFGGHFSCRDLALGNYYFLGMFCFSFLKQRLILKSKGVCCFELQKKRKHYQVCTSNTNYNQIFLKVMLINKLVNLRIFRRPIICNHIFRIAPV